MKLEDFVTNILTETEREQLSKEEIEQLFAMSFHFADFAFKTYVDKKVSTTSKK